MTDHTEKSITKMRDLLSSRAVYKPQQQYNQVPMPHLILRVFNRLQFQLLLQLAALVVFHAAFLPTKLLWLALQPQALPPR